MSMLSSTMISALQVSLYGLGGVFATLILFYVVTKLMIAVAQKLPPSED